MEPPNKRRRIGENILQESDDDDELSFLPEEASARKDPEFRLSMHRAKAESKLQSAMENIFAKYEKSFEGVGDEVDMMTGEVLVDNGHLKKMRKRRDILPALRQDEDNSEDDEYEDQSDSDEDSEIAKQAPRRHLPTKKNVWRLPEDLLPPGAEPPQSAFNRTAFRGHTNLMRGSPLTASIVVRRAHMPIPHRRKIDAPEKTMPTPVMSGALRQEDTNQSSEKPRRLGTAATSSMRTSAVLMINQLKPQRPELFVEQGPGKGKQRNKRNVKPIPRDLVDVDEPHDGDISEFVHEKAAPKPKRPGRRRKKKEAADGATSQDPQAYGDTHAAQVEVVQTFRKPTEPDQRKAVNESDLGIMDLSWDDGLTGMAEAGSAKPKASTVSAEHNHHSTGKHHNQSKFSRVISYTTKIPLRPAHEGNNPSQPSLGKSSSTLPDLYEADGETTQVEDEGSEHSASDGACLKRRSGRSRRQSDQFGRISWLQVRAQKRAEKKTRALQRMEDARLRREKREAANMLPQSRLMWTVKSPCLRRISELIPDSQAELSFSHSGGQRLPSRPPPARKKGRAKTAEPLAENVLSDEEAPVPLAKKAPDKQVRSPRELLAPQRGSRDANVVDSTYSGARFAVRSSNINPLTGKRVYVRRRPPTINPLTGRRIYVRKKPLNSRRHSQTPVHSGTHQSPMGNQPPAQSLDKDSDATITDPEMADDVQDSNVQLSVSAPARATQNNNSAVLRQSPVAVELSEAGNDGGQTYSQNQNLTKSMAPDRSLLLLPRESMSHLTLTPIQEVLHIVPDASVITREPPPQAATVQESSAIPSSGLFEPRIESQREDRIPVAGIAHLTVEQQPTFEKATNGEAKSSFETGERNKLLPGTAKPKSPQGETLAQSQLPSSIPNSTSTASPFTSQSLPPSSPFKARATSLPPKITPQKRKLFPHKPARIDRTPSRSPLAGSPTPSSNRSILSMVSEDEEDTGVVAPENMWVASKHVQQEHRTSMTPGKYTLEPAGENPAVMLDYGSPQPVCGQDRFECGRIFCFTCGSSKSHRKEEQQG